MKHTVINTYQEVQNGQLVTIKRYRGPRSSKPRCKPKAKLLDKAIVRASQIAAERELVK